MVKIVGIGQDENNIFLYYTYSKNSHNFFKLITSTDGFEFNGMSKYAIVTDERKREETDFGWKSVRIAREKDHFMLLYKRPGKKILEVTLANSSDLIRWNKLGTLTDLAETAALVPNYKYKNKYVVYTGEKDIRVAMSG